MAATDPVEAPRIADFARYRVEPGERIALADHDPGDTGPYASAEEAGAELGGLVERIADFQERLYAEERRAVLVVRVRELEPEPAPDPSDLEQLDFS